MTRSLPKSTVFTIDGFFSPETFDRLAPLAKNAPETSSRVILDFSKVSGINPGSVVQLMTLSTLLLTRNQRLILCSLNEECRRAVDTNDPRRTLLVAESQEAALQGAIKSFRRTEAG